MDRRDMSRGRHVIAAMSIFAAAGVCVAGEPAPLALGEKETIVFVGDSITAAGHYVRYVEAYLRTRFPERSFRIVAAGRRSETLSGLTEPQHPGPRPTLFARFDSDVVPHAPTWVVASYGMNDGIYHPFSDERFGCYQQGVGQLLARAQSLKARVLLLTPPVCDLAGRAEPELAAGESYSYKKPFPGYDDVLHRYSEWLNTLRLTGIHVADVHASFRAHLDTRRETEPDFRMQKDSIHPDHTGHLLIAMAVLQAWNAPALVSEESVDAKGKKDLSFSWTSKLPMPVEETWDKASMEAERFTERFNRQRLRVRGLRPGRHELKADGEAVGTFTAEELAGGIDVSALQGFPTTARSREVLMTLRKRAQADPDHVLVLDARLAELCRPRPIALRLKHVRGAQP
jgi:lysophospholipase L1-like esterase